MNDALATVVEQERQLVFPAFSEAAAFSIGSAIRQIALAEDRAIVCDIRLWDRPLFYAALAGTAADNCEWVRRKANVVKRFGKSTFRMVLERGVTDDNRAFPTDKGMSPSDYVLAGGGFPITIQGVGIIGAITVSGVPEHIDHMLVVRGLCQYLELDAEALALPKRFT